MGVKEKAEACGRCAMTTVVGASDGESASDPFDGDAIEVSEEEMTAVSRHVVALGSVKTRLDEWATKITYGR